MRLKIQASHWDTIKVAGEIRLYTMASQSTVHIQIKTFPLLTLSKNRNCLRNKDFTFLCWFYLHTFRTQSSVQMSKSDLNTCSTTRFLSLLTFELLSECLRLITKPTLTLSFTFPGKKRQVVLSNF